MINKTVIICGVVRDREKSFPKSIQIIEKIGNLFKDYLVVIFENNSIDSTPRLLKKWAQQNKHVVEFTEKLDENSIVINTKEGKIYHPEGIAYARNKVMDFIESKKEFDYVLWIDPDFEVEPDYAMFIETCARDNEWDAIFANGINGDHLYWDWYALRDEAIPLGSEILGQEWWRLERDSKFWQKVTGWYPVLSAFGGCGLYKAEAVQGCRYSAIITPALSEMYTLYLDNNKENPIVQKYEREKNQLREVVVIDSPKQNLPILGEDIQIKVPWSNHSWRMSSFVGQYPSVCEHVPFHAQMRKNGFKRFYINPKLIFRYGTQGQWRRRCNIR